MDIFLMNIKTGLNEVVCIKWLAHSSIHYVLDEYTWIDIVEESIFSNNSATSFRNHAKSYRKFFSEPQIKEADLSLHVSKNISFRLFGKDSLKSSVWGAAGVNNFVACLWMIILLSH